MEITVSKEQGKVTVTVLQIKGDVNASNHLELQNRAEELVKDGTRYMLIDFSGVPYISSAGLRVLNQIFNWLRSDPVAESNVAVSKGITSGTFVSPHLKLLNPTPRVMDTLKLSGFDMFLQIFKNKHDAVDSF